MVYDAVTKKEWATIYTDPISSLCCTINTTSYLSRSCPDLILDYDQNPTTSHNLLRTHPDSGHHYLI